MKNTYLIERDRQDPARGNLLDLGIGLGIVHDRVTGRVLVDGRRFLIHHVDALGIGLGVLGRLDRIGDRRGIKGRQGRRGLTRVEIK
jgi:hypothetical protein